MGGAGAALKPTGAERCSRVTTLLAEFVIKLLQARPTTQAVGTLTRPSWSTVNAITANSVDRGMLLRVAEVINYLAISEKSLQKGHIRQHPDR